MAKDFAKFGLSVGAPSLLAGMYPHYKAVDVLLKNENWQPLCYGSACPYGNQLWVFYPDFSLNQHVPDRVARYMEERDGTLSRVWEFERSFVHFAHHFSFKSDREPEISEHP